MSILGIPVNAATVIGAIVFIGGAILLARHQNNKESAKKAKQEFQD